MKVKITGKNAGKWYSNRVGEVFEVVKTPDENGRNLFTPAFYTIYKDKLIQDSVLESDCEEFEEDEVEENNLSKDSKIQTIIDPKNSENYLLVIDKSNIKKLYLKLGSESRKRNIGFITISTKTLHLKRVKSKHLHRATNSYGFNDYLIRESKIFDTIELIDDTNRWKFPKSLVLEKGVHLYFKNEGFEKQIFVSLATLKDYIVKPII